MEQIDTQARGAQLTTWSNPTDKVVRFQLRSGPKVLSRTRLDPNTGRRAVEHPGYVEIVIPPGGAVQLDSRYDHAIQRIEGGLVQSGLAPMLVKNGAETPMHPSLDPDATEAKEQALKAAAALTAKQTAETALVVAQAASVDAEKRSKGKKSKAEES